MDDIRDDGGARFDTPDWQSAADFLSVIRDQAATLHLYRTQGQPVRVMILCETARMAPQLARVTAEFGVPVISSGGFDSVTEKHGLTADIAADGRPAEILRIGDHDPSGTHLFLALQEDVTAFAGELGGSVTFSRLAVIPKQICDLDLSTAPPKASDNRAFAGQTCQAEAIAPDLLARILREAIEARLDRDAYRATLRRERDEPRYLAEVLARGAP